MKNMPAVEKQPVLSLINVSKRFGGVVAADQISFDLYRRDLRADRTERELARLPLSI